MATPNSSISEMAAVTLKNYSKTLADNVTTHNPLLNEIFMKGNIKEATGEQILQEIEFAENGTSKWYSGYETLDTSASEVLTAAAFDYRQFNVNVVFSGLDQIKNSGPERVHDLIKSRIKVAEKTAMNAVATEIFNDGTDSKKINGLRLLVSSTPTSGVVGGINRATSTNSWWRNQTETGVASSGNITLKMNSLYRKCERNGDQTDVIIFDDIFYGYYEDSLQNIHRIASDKTADAGFSTLMYKGAKVIYDSNCTASTGFFLNTDYLFFRPAKGRNFAVDDKRMSVNQDATIIPMFWAGNLTLSNAARQGRLTT